jgi:hypothetical protein
MPGFFFLGVCAVEIPVAKKWHARTVFCSFEAQSGHYATKKNRKMDRSGAKSVAIARV